MKINLKDKRGFSLVELMMTVSIIIIFSTVVFASLNSSRQKSRDAVRQGDLKSLSLAAERYFSENFKFPDTIGDLGQYFTNEQVTSIPKDPMTGADYFYKKYDDTNGHHSYCFAADMETSITSTDIPDINPAHCVPTSGHDYIIKGP